MMALGSFEQIGTGIHKRGRIKTLLLGTAALLIWGCAMPEVLDFETTGEKFRKVLAAIDAQCKKRGIGPYLSPLDPEFQSKSPLRNCEVLKVKPFDLNAVLATEEGRFAYSIKLPAPLDKPQVVYTKEMSARDYFEALCDKESGDFIFSTVKDVDRVRQLRAPPTAGQYSLGSYSEEGLLFAAYSSPGGVFVAPATGVYSYLETPNTFAGSDNGVRLAYRLFYRDPTAKQGYPAYGVNSRPIAQALARYAFVWRGIHRDGARELGIWGGELIVLDMTDMRILAVRRGFAIDAVNVRNHNHVDFRSQDCRRNFDEGVNFVARVLKPAR